MKVVFALSAVLMQSLVADAVMYYETEYSGADCTAGNEVSKEWKSMPTCHNMSTANQSLYMTASCSGDTVEFRFYTDNKCATLSTGSQKVGTGACAVTVNDGLFSTSPNQCHLPPSGCSTDKPKMRTCASQPEQISMSMWSDAKCTTAHKDGSKYSQAIGVCDFEQKSSGGRRLQTYESEKRTWSNGVLTETTYETKDCTGTVKSNSTMSINSTCQSMGGGRYYKLDAHMTSSQAAAAVTKASTSGGKSVWSKSVGSVLVSLAVAKTLI